MGNRWVIYQAERFPLIANGALIGALSVSSTSYSRMLRGETGPVPLTASIFAFVSVFIVFAQLRVADEFKDHDDDQRYRPYRPVPRGLVTLAELRALAIVGGAVQLAVAVAWGPALVGLLAVVWVYMGLMASEFFAGAWLRNRPFVYMVSHMVVVPLVVFYATAFDWLVAGTDPLPGLVWFLSASLLVGAVFEIGRKIRRPDEEETGVETYSALWGVTGATLAWLAVALMSAMCAIRAASLIGFGGVAALVLMAAFLVPLVLGIKMNSTGTAPRRKTIEAISGMWVLLMYLTVGIAPLAWRTWIEG